MRDLHGVQSVHGHAGVEEDILGDLLGLRPTGCTQVNLKDWKVNTWDIHIVYLLSRFHIAQQRLESCGVGVVHFASLCLRHKVFQNPLHIACNEMVLRMYYKMFEL